MSRICDVTGKKSLKGNQVSHAMNHSIIHQQPNLHKKRFWVSEENKWVTLKVSTRAIRTINKNGITAVLKKMTAKQPETKVAKVAKVARIAKAA